MYYNQSEITIFRQQYYWSRIETMSNLFFQIGEGNIRSVVPIGRDNSGDPQSINAAVSDGDTVRTFANGNLGVRFLGIDTPEKVFDVPGAGRRRLDRPEWEEYLTNPFDPSFNRFGTLNLNSDLVANLSARLGADAASNHRRYGDTAENSLIEMIQTDMNTLGQTPETFSFFLAFSFEILDGFGRFLAFINRNQPDANEPEPRPANYNQRLLERGAALPYFIWPNIDPFRSASNIVEAARRLAPGTANDLADSTQSLRTARQAVQQARANGDGIFDSEDPLRIEPFEVRYLGRRRTPSRFVIDLSRNEDRILQPQSYHRISNPEDRLFIPREYVPLFREQGWQVESE